MLKPTCDPDYAPPHPGEILREDILPRLAMSRSALASHLGMSRRTLAALLDERRPITFEIAQRLGAALGSGTRYWLGLQAQHDIWRAGNAAPMTLAPVAWQDGRATGGVSAPRRGRIARP